MMGKFLTEDEGIITWTFEEQIDEKVMKKLRELGKWIRNVSNYCCFWNYCELLDSIIDSPKLNLNLMC